MNTSIKLNKSRIKLDKYDKLILQELEEDARKPLTELSKKVKLSRDAIRNRINKLIAGGIISGFKPVYNFQGAVPGMVRGTISYVLLSLQDPFDEKKVVQHLKPVKNITNISRLFGKWDYLLQIIAKEQSETDKILTELRKAFPMKEQEVYSVLNEEKKEVCYIENVYK